MLNARPAVAAHALSSARLFSLPLLSASTAQHQPTRSIDQQCYPRQPLQRAVHPSQSFLLPPATRGACGSAPPAHFARAFFKSIRPSPSFAATDPFANLQTNSRQLKKVLQDENALYRSFLDENPKLSPLANDLRLQILQGQDTINTSIAARLGNFDYWSVCVQGKYPVLMRKRIDNDSREEIVIDQNDIAKNHRYVGVMNERVSRDDGQVKVAFAVDTDGHQRWQVWVRDVAENSIVQRVPGAFCLEWYSDSTTCIISLYDDLLRPFKVIKHRLGHPLASAVDVFNEPDASVYIDVSCSKDGKIMFVSKNSKNSSEVWFASSADPSADFRCVRRRREGVRYFVEHHDGWLYIMHNDGNRNFRVSRARVVAGEQCGPWEDFVAEDENGAVLEDMDMYENCMLLFYRRRGIVEVTKVQLQNNHYARSLLPMPIPYTSIVPSANADIRAGEVSFELSSPVCPPQTVTIPLYNNAPSTIVATKRCHDSLMGNDFEVRMESFVARDGTEIPATIVLSRHASARNTLVRAYGAYGQSLPTAFKYDDVPLLLRGWNIVFLHVRGGGELGSAWHDQGRRLLKAASSNDVVDGIMWLRMGHLSSRVNCIVLETYSAGALSVATAASDAMLARAAPNSPSVPMISALLLQYAFVDPLSAMMDASLSLTVHERDEWGDPIADETAKSLLQNISPYHRVLKGQLPVCPVLLMNSAIDVRVQPWQQAKFVQAIRSSMQQSNQLKRKHLGDHSRNALPPVLMVTDFCNGHMGPDDPVQQAENSAAILAWMLFAVGEI